MLLLFLPLLLSLLRSVMSRLVVVNERSEHQLVRLTISAPHLQHPPPDDTPRLCVCATHTRGPPQCREAMMVRAFGREGTNSIGQADLLVSRRGGVVVAVKHQHRVTLMALPTHTQRGVGGVLSVSLVIDPHTTHTNTHTISLVASWRLFHGLISRANAAAANPPKESVCEALLTVMGTGEDECVAASPASMSTGNVLPAPPAIVQRGDKNNTLVGWVVTLCAVVATAALLCCCHRRAKRTRAQPVCASERTPSASPGEIYVTYRSQQVLSFCTHRERSEVEIMQLLMGHQVESVLVCQ